LHNADLPSDLDLLLKKLSSGFFNLHLGHNFKSFVYFLLTNWVKIMSINPNIIAVSYI
jgi:hypothetical protein